VNSGREVSHTSPSALRAWVENALNRLNSTMNGTDSLRGDEIRPDGREPWLWAGHCANRSRIQARPGL